MVSGNLGFPSETSVKNPVNSLFFAFFLHKRFVKFKAVSVVYLVLDPPNVVLLLL